MTATPPLLDEATWRSRAAAHAERVDALVGPHLERREAQVEHPVHDFLFTYYSHRPAQLRRWHPGAGVRLENGAVEYGGLKGYDADPASPAVSSDHVLAQRPLLEQLHRLLSATAARPAHLGCFGLHEWAMVYRLADDETRHADWPLRLGGAGTDRVVESHRIACSHEHMTKGVFFSGVDPTRRARVGLFSIGHGRLRIGWRRAVRSVLTCHRGATVPARRSP